MKADEITKLLLGFLENKRAVTEQVLDNLQRASTVRRGLDRLVQQLADESTELNFRKTCLALIKSMGALASAAEQNGVLALLYVVEGDFDVNAALMLGRLGKGNEGLQQMWKNKMRGNG